MKVKIPEILVRYLTYCLLILHAIASGLFLVQLATVCYFGVFPPIPSTLVVFYIGVVILILVLGVVIYYLFKRGKRLIAVWVIGTAVILVGFGVPIFMVENNHMLWHQDPFGEGPDNLIDFSPREVKVLKCIYFGLYVPIMKVIYLPALLYIFVYLGVALYFWRRKRGGAD